MAGLKDLFRKKSKKDLRGDAPTSPVASPGRASSGGATRSQTSVSPPPPIPTSPITPTQSKTRAGQAGTPEQSQNTSLVGPAAVPYDRLPRGAPPEKGTYPLHGNGSSAFPSGQDPAQPHTSHSRTDSVGRVSNIATTAVAGRTGVPPGTALTTDEVNRNVQRTGSRSSAYTDTSHYSDEPSTPTKRYRQTDAVPPIPKPHEGLLESEKRTAPGALPNNTLSNQSVKHNRIVSASSTTSNARTPIADEFAAPAWYNQRGSPPVPEFVQLHPRSPMKPAPPDYQLGAGVSRPQETYGQNITAGPRKDLRTTAAIDRSVELGKVLASSDNTVMSKPLGKRQAQDLQPAGAAPDGASWANGDASALYKYRKSSIPRQSLEKPLPAPNNIPAAGPPNGVDVRNEQELPLRERGAPVDTSNTTIVSEQASPTRKEASIPSSPVRPGRYSNPPVQPSSSQSEIRSGPQTIYNRAYTVENSTNPVSLEGIVDLRNTVHTYTDVRYAPAVVHETVIPQVHHIREERVTREIHNYHLHHRVLPVVDVRVLPVKHITRSNNADDGQWVEIPEELVPGRHHRNWVIAETVTKFAGDEDGPAQGPRQFTARTFEGAEGDYREYINADGVPTTETTWVHPPSISQDARLRGITAPLDMEME